MAYDLFISYRRETGAETARAIRTGLSHHGVRSFIDVDDLGSQQFDDRIFREIELAPGFLVILTPGSLDRCSNENDWLRREIAYAIAMRRNVIMLLKDGFVLPAQEKLPPDLRALPSCEKIEYSHIYYDAMIAELVRHVKKPLVGTPGFPGGLPGSGAGSIPRTRTSPIQVLVLAALAIVVIAIGGLTGFWWLAHLSELPEVLRNDGILPAAGDSPPTPVSQNESSSGNPQDSAESENPVVTFQDTKLEGLIRMLIGKPCEGVYKDTPVEQSMSFLGQGPCQDIYRSELDHLTDLQADGWKITDLEGIQYCANVTTLDLSFNNLTDISPLQDMTSLTQLDLSFNYVSDIRPIRGLRNLLKLDLTEEKIGDIQPLLWLPNLRELELSRCGLTDITGFEKLTNLKILYLDENDITDISPLANNPGLGPGCTVALSSNPLNRRSINEYIPALRGRGVEVLFSVDDSLWPPVAPPDR